MNAKNARGDSVLHFAVLSMNTELVKLLLECGADANCIDEDHWSPLHVAAALPVDKDNKDELQTQLLIVQWLLLHGANPFLRCRRQRSSDKPGITVFDLYSADKVGLHF